MIWYNYDSFHVLLEFRSTYGVLEKESVQDARSKVVLNTTEEASKAARVDAVNEIKLDTVPEVTLFVA